MWVLIGIGPNSVEIPALVWTDGDKARNQCVDDIFKRPADNAQFIDGNYQYTWYSEDEDDELPVESLYKMFNHYYGGCGECYAATLKFVEEGKPFVSFDLD